MSKTTLTVREYSKILYGLYVETLNNYILNVPGISYGVATSKLITTGFDESECKKLGIVEKEEKFAYYHKLIPLVNNKWLPNATISKSIVMNKCVNIICSYLLETLPTYSQVFSSTISDFKFLTERNLFNNFPVSLDNWVYGGNVFISIDEANVLFDNVKHYLNKKAL